MSERTETQRGFARWNIPNSQYRGEPERIVTVQESSLATEFRVWVGYSDSDRMHLTAEVARELRDALTEWLDEVAYHPEVQRFGSVPIAPRPNPYVDLEGV